MKRIALLVLAAAGLVCAACEDPVNVNRGGSGELHIRVTAPGFGEDLSPLLGVSQNAARTLDTGYNTTFVGGEEIGITVVKGGVVVLGQDNIQFRYNGTVWAAVGGPLKLVSGATYLAYYPYSAGMTGKTDEAAIVSGFTLPVIQNTQATYASADLMTWSGPTPSGTTLNVQFGHKMALVEVDVPSGATAVQIKIGNASPTAMYLYSGTVYRYIVTPQTVTISGTYTHSSLPLTWKQENAVLTPGSYTKATVSNNFYPGNITVNYEGQSPETVTISTDYKIPYTRTDSTLITSVVVGGTTYYVGRKADTSDLKMKFDANGTLQFRTADSGGFIPIGSYAEFQLINRDAASLAASYKQEADINLMNRDWTPIGTGNGSNAFKGILDGNRKTVSNLTITTPRTYAGLFGYTDTGSEIKNAGITGVNIQFTTSDPTPYAGGIAGYGNGASKITNCYSTGTITVTATGDPYPGGTFGVGGIAGRSGGTIAGCYSGGTVSATATGYSYVDVYWIPAGGIVGHTSGTVRDCYSTANVSSESTSSEYFAYNRVAAGGIAGRMETQNSIVTKSYSTGAVTGTKQNQPNNILYAGGITGTTQYTGNIPTSSVAANPSVTGIVNGAASRNYVNRIIAASGTYSGGNYALDTMTITVYGNGDAGTSKTETELKTQSTYEGLGWDFGSIWKMPAGGGYPILQWQQ